MHAHVRQLGARERVDHRDPVVEARVDVQPVVRGVEREAARTAGRQGNVVGGVGREGVRIGGGQRQLGGVDDADLSGAEGRDVERRGVGADREVGRDPQARGVGRRGRDRERVVDVLVQEPRADRPPGREDRDARLVQLTAQVRRAEPLEAVHVVRVGVADVEDPVRRHDHVEQDRPDMVVGADQRRRAGGGVEREHVVVGEAEGDRAGVAVAVRVLPGRPQLLLQHHRHDRGGQRGRIDRPAVRVQRRRERLERAERRGALVRGQGGGLVAGMEHGGVHGRAVGGRCERARGVAEQIQKLERRSAQRRAEVGAVEDPDVAAADGAALELRVAGPVLPAVCGGDERQPPPGAGEDDVARLVSHEQRPGHAQRRHVDDGDAVREVVHHPDLAVRAGRDGDGLDPDLDGADAVQARRADGKDLEPSVGDVAHEQERTVWRKRDRTDRPRLEQRVAALGGRTGRRERAQQRHDGDKASQSLLPEGPSRAAIIRHGPQSGCRIACARMRTSEANP